jgi:hypothetical protein
MALRACLFLLAILATFGGNIAADEPLPPPRIAPGEPHPPVVYRVSQYEVWQHLSVDRQGRFRPRVIDTPYGAFYSYSGQPYPWTSANQQKFMPYVNE